MAKLTLDKIDVAGKRVLMRVDFNVPLNEEGDIADDTRIRSAIPSIKHVLQNGGCTILMSHLGRPKGKRDPQLSLAVVAKRLVELLDNEVIMVPDCLGEMVERICDSAEPGMVILLENLRFHSQEEDGDPDFAQKLANLCDIYVNNAFGTAHRAHASTSVIADFTPVAVAGFLMAKEIEFLDRARNNPEHPFVVILGGAKVSSKLGVIENMLPRADQILIGGGMSYTFLAATGHKIGKSLLDEQLIDTAKSILMNDTEGKIILRCDCLCADTFSADAKPIYYDTIELPDNLMGLDLGRKSIELFTRHIAPAKMVFWNGPMGVFEFPAFSEGTKAIAKAVSSVDISIIGGGDTVRAVTQFGIADRFTHVSTGGGASLEFMGGSLLPSIEALTDA